MTTTYLAREAIETILPHRGRALMLDRAEVDEEDGRLTAKGYFTVTDEVCEGHLPGHPILRGVDRVEILALTLGVAVLSKLPEGMMAFFGSVQDVKFRGQTTVGDEVRAEVTVLHKSQHGAKGRGILFVGDKKVCEVGGMTGVIGPLQV